MCLAEYFFQKKEKKKNRPILRELGLYMSIKFGGNFGGNHNIQFMSSCISCLMISIFLIKNFVGMC